MGTSYDRDNFASRWHLNTDQIKRLEQFVALFKQWNARIQMVSVTDSKRLWSRHVEDSLRLIPLIAHQRSITDFGSGGGFPGIITALLTDLPHTLIESDQRKAIFLQQIKRQFALDLVVMNTRIETIEPMNAPCITARALAPFDQLLTYAYRHLSATGRCFFYKGRKAQQEQDIARHKGWMFHVKQHRNPYRADSVVLEVWDIQKQ